MANKWLDFFENNSMNKLNYNQLRQAEKSLIKTVNQRLVRLERSEVTKSTVIDTLKSHMEDIGAWTEKGRVSGSDKKIDDVRASIQAMRQFLNSRTSTVKGLHEVKKEAQETFKANFDMSDEEASKLADAFKFAREDMNRDFHVDSGTVEIARNAENKKDFINTLKKYGYDVSYSPKDKEAREFYHSFRNRMLGLRK